MKPPIKKLSTFKVKTKQGLEITFLLFGDKWVDPETGRRFNSLEEIDKKFSNLGCEMHLC